MDGVLVYNNYNGSEMSDDDNSLFSLGGAFDYEALFVVTQQEVDGKMVEGWTCAYCPCLNDGGVTFHSCTNEWNKLRGRGVNSFTPIGAFMRQRINPAS